MFSGKGIGKSSETARKLVTNWSSVRCTLPADFDSDKDTEGSESEAEAVSEKGEAASSSQAGARQRKLLGTSPGQGKIQKRHFLSRIPCLRFCKCCLRKSSSAKS